MHDGSQAAGRVAAIQAERGRYSSREGPLFKQRGAATPAERGRYSSREGRPVRLSQKRDLRAAAGRDKKRFRAAKKPVLARKLDRGLNPSDGQDYARWFPARGQPEPRTAARATGLHDAPTSDLGALQQGVDVAALRPCRGCIWRPERQLPPSLSLSLDPFGPVVKPVV
jgi:hypothetical protein